jgi:hypothetical protein
MPTGILSKTDHKSCMFHPFYWSHKSLNFPICLCHDKIVFHNWLMARRWSRRDLAMVDFNVLKYIMIPEWQSGLSPSEDYFQFLFRQYWKHGNVCDNISQYSLVRENSKEVDGRIVIRWIRCWLYQQSSAAQRKMWTWLLSPATAEWVVPGILWQHYSPHHGTNRSTHIDYPIPKHIILH